MPLTKVQTEMAGTGAVLQVVSANIKTQASTTGDTYVASPITVSITPKSSTSKILVLGSAYVRASTTGVGVVASVFRNSTNLTSGTVGLLYAYSAAGAIEIGLPFTYLDSPATTSSTAYTLYFKRSDSAGTAYVGLSQFDSTITLMEIAG